MATAVMSRAVPAWIAKSPTMMRACGLAPPPPPRAPAIVLPVEKTRERKTDRQKLSYARHRRARLRAAKRCINGWRHGLATHGCRCEACHVTHKASRKYKKR